MSIPVVSFFNNKGGVGKTSLVYHLAGMFSHIDVTVLAVDLDPQANLTSMYMDEEAYQKYIEEDQQGITVFRSLKPLLEGTGDFETPAFFVPEYSQLYSSHRNQWYVPGDLRLSLFEDQLSKTWAECLDGQPRAFRVTSVFWRMMQQTAYKIAETYFQGFPLQLILVDLGPNLGSLNRAVILSSDHVVVPMAPDLFSLQGLRNLGPTLRKWRSDWKKRLTEAAGIDIPLPAGKCEPIGYVVQQHAVRLDRPVKAYDKWLRKIPNEYRVSVLDIPSEDVRVESDPHCLSTLKHYRSLMPLAQEARKPMFFLDPSDGALGAHALAAKDVYKDYHALALRIAERCGIEIPSF